MSDLDVICNDPKPISRSSRRNSLFNNSDDVVEVLGMHKSALWKDYEQQLRQEIREWGAIWRDTVKELVQSKEKHPTIDKSILPPHKIAYLDAAPNLQMFLRESVEFCQEANLFLEYDYEEMSDDIEILKELCDHNVHVAKANAHGDHLAGNNEKSPA